MNFEALASFIRVAKHESVRAASRATGQPKATLSRHIRDLESSLQVRLVERGSRRLMLTEAGRALHARTAGLFAEIENAAKSIGDESGDPSGLLRISAPVMLAQTSVARIVARFVLAHPTIEVELVADDRWADPVEDGFDLVVRVDPRPEHDLVGFCFLRDERLVVAAPSIDQPAAAQDDLPVPVILKIGDPFDGRRSTAGAFAGLKLRPVLRLSSLLMVREAAIAGSGLAVLPRSLIEGDLAVGHLVSWGRADNADVEVWIMHTSGRLLSKKVSTFVTFLRDTGTFERHRVPDARPGRN